MSTHAIYDLSQLGLICFSGEEAQRFLQNQLSCDVEGLTPNRSTYGSYCTPKGRVLATFLLWRSEQGYFMQLPAALCEPIRQRLSKFILRSKVKATDASNAFARFGIAGNGAGTMLKPIFGDAPAAMHEVRHPRDATLIKLPVDRFEAVVKTEKAATIREALRENAGEAASRTWNWLEIRAGIPMITPATQEEFVPQMVNLDLIGGVSFTKGCYPGQEIVARMHYRGGLKQRMHLAHLESDTAPQPGDKLYSPELGGQSCGMIVNAAPLPEGGYDALAVIQMSSVEAGQVHWATPQGPALRFLALPYHVY